MGRRSADIGASMGAERGRALGRADAGANAKQRPKRPLRVLITGGAGFIGSHLAEAFLEQGARVTALDRGPSAKVAHLLEHPRFQLVNGSVLDRAELEPLVADADLVYHLAAVVGVEHYVGDPYEVLHVNVDGTENVLDLALAHGCRVVFSSTSEVYGRNPHVPWSEDSDRVLGSTGIDRWCYSTSKAVGEHFCFAYGRRGLPVTVLRYFNVYGPRLDRADVGRVITIFIGQLLRNQPLTVVNQGRQTRCFTYIDDAVRATVAAGLCEAAVGKVINVGSDVELSILELAERMIKLAKSGSTIELVPEKAVYGNSYEDIQRRVPDVTRMREILGVHDLVPLDVGMRRTLDWFAAQARS